MSNLIGWQRRSWGEIATLAYGRAPTHYGPTKSHGDVPLYGTNGRFGYTTTPLASGPTVIVGRKGAYRGIHFVRGPFWVVDTGFYLVPIEPIDPRWAYYELLTHDINGMDSGSAIPSTSRPDFYAMPVIVPPLAEQRRIGATLGLLDDKIDSDGRIVTYASAYLHALAQTLTGLPRTPLQSLSSASRELLDPQSIDAEAVDHFSIPAYDVGGMPEVSSPLSIKSGKFAVRGPRVLVSRLNPRTPRVWYAVPSSRTALASTEFLVLDDPEFQSLATIFLSVTAESFTSEMQRRATGTSGSHQRVRPTDALAIEVPDTHRADPAMVDKADALLRVLHQARVESRALVSIRDVLLPELLSGRLHMRGTQGNAEGAA